MLDVQCLYMKSGAAAAASGGVGADKNAAAAARQRKRRSSRAYSRARAFSVNETASMHKSASNSHSTVSIHENQLLTPESPEIHPPCYADVVNNSLGYIKQALEDDNGSVSDFHWLIV